MRRISSEQLTRHRLERAERNGVIIAWAVKPLAGGAELISVVNILHSHLRRRGPREQIVISARKFMAATAPKKRKRA
jgi:hypothetical protein